MTWTCKRCGKVYLSEYDMLRCSCQASKPCPDCNGTGYKVVSLGPNIRCSRCNGSGRIHY